MAASTRNLLVLVVLLGALRPAASATKQAQLPLDVNAQASEIDYKNKSISLTKVRIAQGALVVTADQGRASGTVPDAAFDNNRWIFKGTVKITLEQGVLNADEAQITIRDRVLTLAVATGKPANFQQKIAKSDKLAQGHADSIEYDVPKGVVHLTGNGWLEYDQTEMHGESLKYDVVAQTVKGEAAEQNNKPLHFIYTPKPQATPNP
jgi:lipopolysaccharide transport protein LptA